MAGRAVQVVRRVSDGVVTPYPKTMRRRVPLTTRPLDAYRRLPARIDTPLVFPAPEGGHLNLDNFRNRDWYDALEAAAIEKRGPYHLRHTFAAEALARWRVDLRTLAADGRVGEDDRQALRAPGPRC